MNDLLIGEDLGLMAPFGFGSLVKARVVGIAL
jgi:hypothetical protein